MLKIYSEKFRDPRVSLPEIVSVPSVEFYGEGYEDSDRRIPDISKAHRLLGWEPKYDLIKTLESTMFYYVMEQKEKFQEGSFDIPFEPQDVHASHN
jgi:UDP-apiose/xylose synthase